MRLVLPCLPLLLSGCVLVVDDGEPGSPSESGPARIVSAGYAFGECYGYCGHDVELDDERVVATHTAWGLEDPPPQIVNQGVLTGDAVIELKILANDLADAGLDPTYGCPDCGDGGSAAVSIQTGDEIVQSVWQHDDPPPVLADAQAILLDDIAVALRDCVATARVTPTACSPVP